MAGECAEQDLRSHRSEGIIPCAQKSQWSVYKTFSQRSVGLPPSGDPARQFGMRDIASHLAKITYFPESPSAPFTAAQYAIELARLMKDGLGFSAAPLIALHALLVNAPEAYLGHRPWHTRAAELALQPGAVVEDARDRLAQSLREAILEGLGVPDLGNRRQGIEIIILQAKERLDVTLERDIGACIDHTRDRMAPPLPRIIRPMTPWTKALDGYHRLYTELTILCGLPAKE